MARIGENISTGGIIPARSEFQFGRSDTVLSESWSFKKIELAGYHGEPLMSLLGRPSNDFMFFHADRAGPGFNFIRCMDAEYSPMFSVSGTGHVYARSLELADRITGTLHVDKIEAKEIHAKTLSGQLESEPGFNFIRNPVFTGQCTGLGGQIGLVPGSPGPGKIAKCVGPYVEITSSGSGIGIIVNVGKEPLEILTEIPIIIPGRTSRIVYFHETDIF